LSFFGERILHNRGGGLNAGEKCRGRLGGGIKHLQVLFKTSVIIKVGGGIEIPTSLLLKHQEVEILEKMKAIGD